MVDILLISHGPFCEGLLNSLQMITGPQNNIADLSLKEGESPDTYRDMLEKKISESQDECLIFCDLKGGTPYNTAGSLKQKYDFELITGMNLPMLISVITTRAADTHVKELVQIALTTENEGIELINLSSGGKQHAKLSLNKNR
jgi:PTS system mannose-specific IIA component